MQSDDRKMGARELQQDSVSRPPVRPTDQDAVDRTKDDLEFHIGEDHGPDGSGGGYGGFFG